MKIEGSSSGAGGSRAARAAPSGRDPACGALDRAGVGPRPRDAHEALRALEAISALLHGAGGPRAAFPDVYAIITRRVAEEASRPSGQFREPAWISRLAGRFCEAYLESVRLSFEGGPQRCGAWEVAHDPGEIAARTPAEEAMLGLAAHINHDLALGIHATIVEHGHGADREMIARYKHDHDVVNELLHEVCFEAMVRLIERHRCPVSELAFRHARNGARRMTMLLLRRWRARVWDVVEALLAASSEGERERVIERMERRALRIARLLTLHRRVQAAGRAVVVSVTRHRS